MDFSPKLPAIFEEIPHPRHRFTHRFNATIKTLHSSHSHDYGDSEKSDLLSIPELEFDNISEIKLTLDDKGKPSDGLNELEMSHSELSEDGSSKTHKEALDNPESQES